MRSLAFFMSVGLLALFPACKKSPEGLDTLHADIVSTFDDVSHLSVDQFLTLDPDQLILLDIREPDEYAVSHLSGAIRISPNADATTALSSIGKIPDKHIQDKHIIVYCSVGWRSSKFAKSVQSTLIENGAISVSNLEGGIFGWHNEKRALVNAAGATDAVHPYNAVWKRYVDRKDHARLTPAPIPVP